MTPETLKRALAEAKVIEDRRQTRRALMIGIPIIIASILVGIAASM